MQPESVSFLLPEMAQVATTFDLQEEYDRYLDRMLDEARQPAAAFKLARAQRLIADGRGDEGKNLLSQLAALNLRTPDFIKTASENGLLPPGGYDASSLLWKCRNCGHSMNESAWHCPNCHKWETYLPDNGRT